MTTSNTPPAVACLDAEDVVRLVETLRIIRDTALKTLDSPLKTWDYLDLAACVFSANEALAPYEEAQP